MKYSIAIFFQALIIIIGIAAITFMLWEPHLEGRNVNATVFEIYFNDPFLACAYLASTPFFIALYQAIKLLGNVKQNQTYSPSSVKALKIIKICALTLVGFVAVGLVYIFMNIYGEDDIAGGVAIGLFIITVSLIVASVAAILKKRLQKTLDQKI